jgi:YjbE family integral membrane protein
MWSFRQAVSTFRDRKGRDSGLSGRRIRSVCRARPSIASRVSGGIEAGISSFAFCVRQAAFFSIPRFAGLHRPLQPYLGTVMELFSTAWLSALLAIVLIDLVLAGDNAIVIALAARQLPAHLQRKAIVWGTVGAIVVRSLMTVGVVWLLKIPGLMLVGGIGLLWIAYKLLVPQSDDNGHQVKATTFWSAMKTIVVADALMGVDNVLGVAGAAKGSFDLVILGLLISVPIVVFGSTVVLKLVERFPIIIYAGAGVLAYTAAHMIVSESLLDPVFDPNLAARIATYAVLVVGVLGAGWYASRRAAARQSQPSP